MGLFDGLRKTVSKVPDVLQRLWTRAPTKDKSEYPDLFHKNPRLTPVHVIGQAVSTTPWKIYKKADIRINGHSATPLEQHPFYDLMDNPMPMYPELDGVALMYLTSVLVDMVGEFFWLKIRATPNGPPVQIYPVPSAWVAATPTLGAPHFLIYPFGVTAGKSFAADASDVVWFKRVDVTDPYSRGRGISESIADEIGADELAAKWQKNTLYNDAMPPFVITAPGATDAQAQSIKDNWISRMGGWLNARKPAVVNWKDATFTKLGNNAMEIDLINSRKFWRDEALQHYQIPPEIFGIVENSNRSTIDASFYLFAKNVVHYRLYALERTIDRQIIHADYDKTLVFRFDQIVPEDEATAHQRLQDGLTSGAVTVDEYRANLKLPPLPNGKGQVFLRAFSVTEVPMSGQTEIVPNADTLQEKPALNIVEPESAPDDKPKEPVTPKPAKAIAKDARRLGMWKSFDARATSTEGPFLSAVRKFAGRQKAKLVEAYHGQIDQGMSPENAVDKALGQVFGQTSVKALKSALAPAWLNAMSEGRKHAFDLMFGDVKSGKPLPKEKPSVGGTFDVTNDAFNAWVESQGLEKAKGLDTTTMEALKKAYQAAISDGISEGMSVSDISDAIMEATDGVYGVMTDVRSMLIARTESCATVNFGQVATYSAEGVKSKEWLSVQDDRTRDDHVDADGQVVGIDEDFDVGSDVMSAPGLGSDPAENCNCRCTILPVLED